MLSLLKSLRLPESPRIAFVGGGGKTTAIFSLARQLPPPVIISATTHLGIWELGLADHVLILEESDQFKKLNSLPTDGVTLLIGPAGNDNRQSGLSESMLKKIIDQIDIQNVPILIEADGSRRRPLKAPAKHEPVIPNFINVVVVVAGMSALWKPLTHNYVHRVKSYSKLSGISIGERITPEAIIKVLGHISGGLKNIPEQAKKILLLNQADTLPLQFYAQEIAESLLTSYERVLVGSLNPAVKPESEIKAIQLRMKNGLDLPEPRRLLKDRIHSVYENIAGIILAGGESSRFGKPKLLVDWNGDTLIRHITRTALDTNLSKILVVTGAYTEEISHELHNLPVVQIHNPDWKIGQSSSIRIGINRLGEYINGAMFILADQPFISRDLIQKLLAYHRTSLAPITAPMVENQRGNPVLFDRSTFSELQTLSGNQGGRTIFDRFSVHYVEWNDPNILADIDTLDDYLRLKHN